MEARFEMSGTHRTELVVYPAHGTEAMLAALFIGFDSNMFTVSIERYEDGQIKSLSFRAGDMR